MATIIQGRIIVRERLVKATNQKVNFYSVKYLDKNKAVRWAQVKFDEAVKIKDLEVPGLVELVTTSAKVKTTVVDDNQYTNTTIYVTEAKNIDSCPELEDVEATLTESRIYG